MPKMCEGCGLKVPSYGLPAEGRKRWCAGCAAAEGSGAVSLKQEKMCEGCGLKQPSYGLPGERRKRWCAGCAAAEGSEAVILQRGGALPRPAAQMKADAEYKMDDEEEQDDEIGEEEYEQHKRKKANTEPVYNWPGCSASVEKIVGKRKVGKQTQHKVRAPGGASSSAVILMQHADSARVYAGALRGLHRG